MAAMGSLGCFYYLPHEINQIIFDYIDPKSLRNISMINLAVKKLVATSVTVIRGDIKTRRISWLFCFRYLCRVEGTIYISTLDEFEGILRMNIVHFTINDLCDIANWKDKGNHRENKKVHALADFMLKRTTLEYIHVKYGGSYENTVLIFDKGCIYTTPKLVQYFARVPIKGIIFHLGSGITEETMFDYEPFLKQNIDTVTLYHMYPGFYNFCPIESILVGNDNIRYITWKSREHLMERFKYDMGSYVRDFWYSYFSPGSCFPKVEYCDLPVPPWQVRLFLTTFPNIRRIVVVIPSRETIEFIELFYYGKDEIMEKIDIAKSFMEKLTPIPNRRNVYLYNGIECGIVYICKPRRTQWG